ncbi:SDR family NAD(P)-dependent oxidoreductase, partial [Enterococcus faecium]|uniref:SDR family NAD(P)-dependent oxidoreductase n=1 Tax=Enterococcus faecium TaxID=1352 RepID=UPI0039E3799D
EMTEQAKIALVTGASRGIGRAIAIGMAKRGFDVAINDIERQQDALQEVARAIEATSRRALTVYADVSNKAQVEAMVSNVVDVFGRIDALVNNAGILIAGDVEHLKEEHWDSVLDVNAKGTFLVVQAALPHMKRQKYGRIVNIASIGGKHGALGQA